MMDGLQMRYDAEVDARYRQLREDDIAETLEIEEQVYLDVDNEGRAVGIEFVSGSDFLPFLQRHGGALLCGGERVRLKRSHHDSRSARG